MPIPSALSLSSPYSISFRYPVDIGKRHASEQAEALGMIRYELRSVVIPDPHRGGAFRSPVVQNVAHLRHRQDRNGDIKLVHLLQGLFWRPRPQASSTSGWRTAKQSR